MSSHSGSFKKFSNDSSNNTKLYDTYSSASHNKNLILDLTINKTKDYVSATQPLDLTLPIQKSLAVKRQFPWTPLDLSIKRRRVDNESQKQPVKCLSCSDTVSTAAMSVLKDCDKHVRLMDERKASVNISHAKDVTAKCRSSHIGRGEIMMKGHSNAECHCQVTTDGEEDVECVAGEIIAVKGEIILGSTAPVKQYVEISKGETVDKTIEVLANKKNALVMTKTSECAPRIIEITTEKESTKNFSSSAHPSDDFTIDIGASEDDLSQADTVCMSTDNMNADTSDSRRDPGIPSRGKITVLSESCDTVQPASKSHPLPASASHGEHVGDSGSDSGWVTDDDTDGNLLRIDMDAVDFDKQIQTKATKNKMSRRHVKAMIREVVSNKDVIEMVKNTLADTLEDARAAPFEPKMTRSRIKEVSPVHVWPLTPIKKSSSDPKFLDMSFSESEDDDYRPDQDGEGESEEDSESVASSHMSDFGSPLPTTPLTPRSTLATDFVSTLTDSPSPDSLEQKAAFAAPSTPRASLLGMKYHKAMEENEAQIANRTRSKMPLTETSLNQLEESFVAPDITADMYDMNVDDCDWTSFLSSLYQPSAPETMDTLFDETNDPEYNFLQEIEAEEVDTEDYRFDKSVKITKKELSELMDELLAAYGDPEIIEIPTVQTKDSAIEEPLSQTSTDGDGGAESISDTEMPQVCLTNDQSLRLQQQMRKHVQLLCQSYVMSRPLPHFKQIADTCQTFVCEIQKFGALNESTYSRGSYFCATNLSAAVALMSQPLYECEVTGESQQRKAAPPLSFAQKRQMFNSPAFMYPELLPENGFLPPNIPVKVKFTNWEDRLIAHGMQQWKEAFPKDKSNVNVANYIHKHMLPAISAHQIHVHIKNRFAHGRHNNPIRMQKKHGYLEPIAEEIEAFHEHPPVAPRHTNQIHELPSWATENSFLKQLKAEDDSLDIARYSIRSTTDLTHTPRKRKSSRKRSLDSNATATPPDISSGALQTKVGRLKQLDHRTGYLDVVDLDLSSKAVSDFALSCSMPAIPLKLITVGSEQMYVSPVISQNLLGKWNDQPNSAKVIVISGRMQDDTSPLTSAAKHPTSTSLSTSKAAISKSQSTKTHHYRNHKNITLKASKFGSKFPSTVSCQLRGRADVVSAVSSMPMSEKIDMENNGKNFQMNLDKIESRTSTVNDNNMIVSHVCDISKKRRIVPVKLCVSDGSELHQDKLVGGEASGSCVSQNRGPSETMVESDCDAVIADDELDVGAHVSVGETGCENVEVENCVVGIDGESDNRGEGENGLDLQTESGLDARDGRLDHIKCTSVRLAAGMSSNGDGGEIAESTGEIKIDNVDALDDLAVDSENNSKNVKIGIALAEDDCKKDCEDVDTGVDLAVDNSKNENDCENVDTGIHLAVDSKNDCENVDPGTHLAVDSKKDCENVDPGIHLAVDSKNDCENVDPGIHLAVDSKNDCENVDPGIHLAVDSKNDCENVDPGIHLAVDSKNDCENVDPEIHLAVDSKNDCENVDPGIHLAVDSKNDCENVDPGIHLAVDSKNDCENVDPEIHLAVDSKNDCENVDAAIELAGGNWNKCNVIEKKREFIENPDISILHEGEILDGAIINSDVEKVNESVADGMKGVHVPKDNQIVAMDVDTGTINDNGMTVGETGGGVASGLELVNEKCNSLLECVDIHCDEDMDNGTAMENVGVDSQVPENAVRNSERVTEKFVRIEDFKHRRGFSVNILSENDSLLKACINENRSQLNPAPEKFNVANNSDVGVNAKTKNVDDLPEADLQNSTISSTNSAVELLAAVAPYFSTSSDKLKETLGELSAPQTPSKRRKSHNTSPIALRYPRLIRAKEPYSPSKTKFAMNKVPRKTPGSYTEKRHSNILPHGHVPPTVTYNRFPARRGRVGRKGNHSPLKRAAVVKEIRPKPSPDIALANTAVSPSVDSAKGDCLKELGQGSKVESDDTQSDGEDSAVQYDSQNEDEAERLEQLMQASTTIRASPKRYPSKMKRSKETKQLETTINLLSDDILDNDPLKTERDAAFVQAYLMKVKDAFVNDEPRYIHFLRILFEFRRTEAPITALYDELTTLFRNHPDLLRDFSAFLLPHQAFECGCFLDNSAFLHAKTFLRKLEIYLDTHHQNSFQKVVRTLCNWSNSSSRDVRELRDTIQPLFKGQKHIVEEFTKFFDDEPPPYSDIRDFEEVSLTNFDLNADVGPDFHDGFESVHMPDDQLMGTKLCQCKCHEDTGDIKMYKRSSHCNSCALKVIGGKIYFHTGSRTMNEAEIIYHRPFRMSDFVEEESSDVLFKQRLSDALFELNQCGSHATPSDEKLDSVHPVPVTQVHPQQVQQYPTTPEKTSVGAQLMPPVTTTINEDTSSPFKDIVAKALKFADVTDSDCQLSNQQWTNLETVSEASTPNFRAFASINQNRIMSHDLQSTNQIQSTHLSSMKSSNCSSTVSCLSETTSGSFPSVCQANMQTNLVSVNTVNRHAENLSTLTGLTSLLVRNDVTPCTTSSKTMNSVEGSIEIYDTAETHNSGDSLRECSRKVCCKTVNIGNVISQVISEEREKSTNQGDNIMDGLGKDTKEKFGEKNNCRVDDVCESADNSVVGGLDKGLEETVGEKGEEGRTDVREESLEFDVNRVRSHDAIDYIERDIDETIIDVCEALNRDVSESDGRNDRECEEKDDVAGAQQRLGDVSLDRDRSDAVAWSREEDRVILETCKSHGGVDGAMIEQVVEMLSNRTPHQVSARLRQLMALISNISGSSDAGETSSEDEDNG